MHSEALDFYSVLNCNPSSTLSEIKASYYRLALKCHPDKRRNEGGYEHECSLLAAPTSSSGTCEAEPLSFEQISRAYQILSDPEQRIEYDTRRAVHQNAGINAEDVTIDEFNENGLDCYYRQCRCGDLYQVRMSPMISTPLITSSPYSTFMATSITCRLQWRTFEKATL